MKLTASRLSFRYHDTGHFVFDSLNLSVSDFSRLALIGRSGSGKSTLLKLLGRALQACSGVVAVELDHSQQPKFGYVHQDGGLLPWLSVSENGMLGAQFGKGLEGFMTNDDRRDLLFEGFGLREYKGRLPKMLSGGMKQRLALVNALTSGADVLLLDEAFSASDVRYRDAIFTELKTYASLGEDKGIIFISHEIADVVELSDIALCLPNRRDGEIECIDARNGWTKSNRRRLAELMLGEAL